MNRDVISMLDQPVKMRTFPMVGLRRRLANGLATVLVSVAVLAALVPVLWLLYSVVSKGWPVISSAGWFVHPEAGSPPGALNAIVGTVLQALTCALIAIPVGIAVAVYLVEYAGHSPLGRMTSFAIDVLAGIPSVIAALVVYTVWIGLLGFSRSSLAVSLSLVLLMTPLIVRSTEEMLRIVPADLREAGYALGLPKWKTIVRIVIPTSISGVVTGIMVSLARVLGETAPLLILVGYLQTTSFELTGERMATLPSMLYEYLSSGAPPADRMWGAALTLVLLIALLGVGARAFAKIVVSRKV